jgi:glyoxylase-like metal-dependent hydrolase (beta-lactamase superfamily II)
MTRTHWIRFSLAIALAGAAWAQDAKTVLQDAAKAMGSPKSIVYSGTGFNGFFGQAVQPGYSWPQRELTGYTRSINYDQKSSKEEFVFKEQVFGGQRQNNQVNGDKAWAVGPNGPNPQLAAAEDRQLQILVTPHGFLQAAMAASDATAKKGKKGTVVSFTALGKYKLQGTIDAQHMVSQVTTVVPNPLLGDVDVICTYSDYKDFGGVKFPTKIKQTQAGGAVADLTITSVMPNAPADLPVPANVQSATLPPPAPATGQKLADGVWLVPTSHNSLVIEFKDYIAVVEAPLTEQRSLAVIAEAKRLVPNKPIKYLFSTHHHFDHSGGLRAYVAEGATIITADVNKSYYEQVFKRKAGMVPDTLSKSPKKPSIIGVKDKYVLTDGTQTLEMYTTQGDQHTGELLIGYLPKPKILIEADSYSPQGPGAAVPAGPPAPNALVLYDNLQRLKLDVSQVVPIHGRPVPYADFPKAVGKG